MKEALKRRRVVIPVALATVGLLVGVSLLAGQSREPAMAGDIGGSIEFGALKPVTADSLAGTSQLVRDRLDFRLFGIERQYERAKRQGRPEVREFGQVELPEGEVFMASIGTSVCAFFERGVGVCGERDEIAVNGVVAVAPRACDSNSVLGIAPGGITEIAFDSDGDGRFEQSTPVISNVYSAMLASREIPAKGTDSSGNVIFEDVLPLDGYAAGTDLCKG